MGRVWCSSRACGRRWVGGWVGGWMIPLVLLLYPPTYLSKHPPCEIVVLESQLPVSYSSYSARINGVSPVLLDEQTKGWVDKCLCDQHEPLSFKSACIYPWLIGEL